MERPEHVARFVGCVVVLLVLLVSISFRMEFGCFCFYIKEKNFRQLSFTIRSDAKLVLCTKNDIVRRQNLRAPILRFLQTWCFNLKPTKTIEKYDYLSGVQLPLVPINFVIAFERRNRCLFSSTIHPTNRKRSFRCVIRKHKKIIRISREICHADFINRLSNQTWGKDDC